jgi:hypothetical protein
MAGEEKSVLWYAKLLKVSSWELIALASSAIINDINAMRNVGLASLTFC